MWFLIVVSSVIELQVEALDRISFELPDPSVWEQVGDEGNLLDSSDDEKATTTSLACLMRAAGVAPKPKTSSTTRKPPATVKSRQGDCRVCSSITYSDITNSC